MSQLARTFPSLRGAPGVFPWDPLELDRWAASGASHGERISVSFVLGVFDPGTEWKAGRFDLMEALRVWDPSHYEAFLKWAEAPWWP